jgi:SAM-dependent methyltransferase
LPSIQRLAYFQANATPEYWDSVWIKQGVPSAIAPSHDVIRLTTRYLSKGSRILEAGCGRGDKVHAMALAGFDPVGIDFAPRTVRAAQELFPTCDIQLGDVRRLDFADCSFDGYWSLGVIEHFWSGYESILREARRVVRPGGYLFLSTPSFSPYRKYKARCGGFPIMNPVPDAEPSDFYQFALGKIEIESALKTLGFELKYWGGRGPEISMLEDMQRFSGFIKWFLCSRGGLAKRITRRLVTRSLANWCGHSFVSVSRRKDERVSRRLESH